MTLIADTGAVYALYDANDEHHAAVVAALEREGGPIIVPMATLGELGYLIGELLGVDAELDFLDSILSGAFVLEPFTDSDAERCRELLDRYRDLDMGLVDAAVMATADRLRTNRVLTVDERDFRPVLNQRGKPYHLLPADGTVSG